MSNYEIWQIEKHGNILKQFNCWPLVSEGDSTEIEFDLSIPKDTENIFND